MIYHKKGLPILLCVLLLQIVACGSNPIEHLNARIERLVRDKEFSEDDFKKILKEAEKLDIPAFKNAEGNIDPDKLYQYVKKYLESRSNDLTVNNLWTPSTPQKAGKFNVHAFIENSASMDGYVNGVTQFESAVYNLLVDFKIADFCDSLNLYYINQTVPYKKLNALPEDIEDFIQKLEPDVFRLWGGNRSVSDLKEVVEYLLKQVNERNATVLVSDFVFSPGPKSNSSPQDYLTNQSIGMRILFSEQLKKQDLGVIVLHMESNFKGYYYRVVPPPVLFEGTRPYYIWIIGTDEQIQRILQEKIVENIKGGYLHKYVLLPAGKKDLPFKLLTNPREGSFDLAGLSTGQLLNAKEDPEKKRFTFHMNVDLSGLPFDEASLTNPSAWRISNPNYKLSIRPLTPQEKNAQQAFTHRFTLTTGTLAEEQLHIAFVPQFPEWVKEAGSTDDRDIANDPEEQKKTFGFYHLFSGVYEAFYPPQKENEAAFININIKLQK